jgi:hypothetical protein
VLETQAHVTGVRRVSVAFVKRQRYATQVEHYRALCRKRVRARGLEPTLARCALEERCIMLACLR